MPIHVVQEKNVKNVATPVCPFCNTEMDDVGMDSEPASFSKYSVNSKAGVWLNYRRFVCHGCGFEARFQEGFLQKRLNP